jgi:hypothetical protein
MIRQNKRNGFLERRRNLARAGGWDNRANSGISGNYRAALPPKLRYEVVYTCVNSGLPYAASVP